jgi:ATP-dependent protease ClpP protease subunit
VDIILASKTPVYTYGEGNVESAALDVFLAGKQRYAYKHTMFMVHGNSTDAAGMNLDNFKSHLDMVITLEDWAKDLLSSRSLLSRSQVDEIYATNKDIFFTVDKAIKCGICTKLIE